MKYNLPKEVQTLLENFRKNNFQIYIVGGAVRNLIMNQPVNDWDFTTDAKPEEVLKLFPDAHYDNKFGTVGIQLSDKKQKKSDDRRLWAPEGEDDSTFEITTMRKEGLYKDSRHPIDVSWTNKIEEDLGRRDFTINAIALTTSHVIASKAKQSHKKDDKWVLIDPFHGEKDIENKLVRAVGDPNLRFEEDALRLMRAIRIATELEFEIEEKTFSAIKKNAKGITDIAWERIRDELFKLLFSNNPSAGILKLRDSGILQIILPELEKCFGIVQEGPKHDRVYDIGEHSMMSLKFTPSKDPLVRLASLLHDIGKPDTVKISPDGNVTFYNHDFIGGKLILKLADRFNLSKKQTDKLFKLVRWHMFSVSENQTDSAIRRFIKNVSQDYIEDIMAIRVGDRLGGGTQTETSWRIETFKERIKEVLRKPFSISDLKVNGKDVMKELKIKPGPKVGEVLQKLFAEVLEDDSKNTREYLLNRIKHL